MDESTVDESRTPSQHRSGARRRRLSVERSGSARAALSGLEPGCEVLLLTYGQFSLVDAIDALLDVTGPADVSITCWTAATFDIALTDRLCDAGRIRSVRWVVDRSFATRHPDYYRQLVARFGVDRVRTTRGHAKLVTIRNETWDLAIRTSMNLNENLRLETLEVSDDAALADFIDGWFDEVYETQEAGVLDGELPFVAPPARVAMGRRVSVGAD